MLGIVMGAVLHASAAGSDLDDVVHVDPGATCLRAVTLGEHVRSWLNRETIDERMVIEVWGDPQRANALRFVVEVDGRATAEREFENAPSDCAELHAAVGLAIAIAIDSTILEPLGIVDTPPPKDPPRVAEPPPPAPAPEPRAAPRGRFAVGAAGIAGIAMHGPASGAGGGELSVRVVPHPAVELAVAGLALAAPQQQLGAGTVQATLAGAAVSICGFVPRQFLVGGCAGVLAGVMFGRGRGFPTPQNDEAPYAAIVVGPTLRYPVLRGRFAIRSSVDAVFPVVRPRFVVAGDDATLAMSPVGGRITLGVEFELRRRNAPPRKNEGTGAKTTVSP